MEGQTRRRRHAERERDRERQRERERERGREGGRARATPAAAAGAGARAVPLRRGPGVLVAAGARLVLDAPPAAGPDAAAGPGPALIFVASVHGSFE
jgi:hypothetical protein